MAFGDNQIRAYRRDGYYFPLTALSPAIADIYRDRFLAFDNSETAAAIADLHNDVYLFKPHLVLTWVDKLIHEASILDLVEALLGPTLLCWSAGIFQKQPHSSNYVSWHQDAVYYGLSPVDHVVRVWVALAPTTHENGTLVYARGAHSLGLLQHDPTQANDNLLTNSETARFDADRYDKVEVLLETGQVSLHHLHMPHCSGPNRSGDRRINVVITYLSPDVRQEHGLDSALLVRGSDPNGNFEAESRPDADFSVTARQQHARAMALRRGIFKTAAAKYADMQDETRQ